MQQTKCSCHPNNRSRWQQCPWTRHCRPSTTRINRPRKLQLSLEGTEDRTRPEPGEAEIEVTEEDNAVEEEVAKAAKEGPGEDLDTPPRLLSSVVTAITLTVIKLGTVWLLTVAHGKIDALPSNEDLASLPKKKFFMTSCFPV